MATRSSLLVAAVMVTVATALAVSLHGPGPYTAQESAAVRPTLPLRLQITDSAPTFVVMPAGTPLELSGLAWAGDDVFYAVSDNDSQVYRYAVDIDPDDGHVRGVTARGVFRPLDADGRPSRSGDLEGIAFDPEQSTLTVVNEAGLGDPMRSILEYRISDARQVGAVSTAGTFFESGRVRGGLGLESLARNGRTVWTANEEALSGDGPRSAPDHGTVVRLTRFEDGRLTGQWAYETEPTGGAFAYFNVHIGGVVDLVALDDGRLLVLERATFGARSDDDLGGFVNRIAVVDPTTGTNVMGRPLLASLERGDGYRPVQKQIVWSRHFPLTDGPTNWEGMALGPVLNDGSRSLLLISDNDTLPSALWALRVSEDPDETTGE